MTNYLLAGGGTAGHVNPLLALAEHIRSVEPDSNVIALGTSEGLEARLVPARNFELQTIDRLPFPRKPNVYALKFLPLFLRAVDAIRVLIRDRKVDVVVGFGGYASAPAYLAAQREGVPYLIHEANALVGLANRFGAKRAAAIATVFASTKLPGAVVTGMPLRPELEAAIDNISKKDARERLGLNPDVPTLLVTGGSLGARRINQSVSEASGALHAAGIQVLHILGGNSELAEEDSNLLKRIKYCDQMELAIAAADLAVARSGASTVCEFGAFGLPAVYVPYPVGNGEQRFNAEPLVSAGGAVLVKDAEFSPEFVRDQVVPLLSNTKQLKRMSKLCKEVSIHDGTERLFALTRSVLPTNTAHGK
jgi:UDP-N-acetylglucosamine--N-acetylmuramyl-(pentapeptide) pyrophosphoryl-undecaprenol N-acetylglucosamine transferase